MSRNTLSIIGLAILMGAYAAPHGSMRPLLFAAYHIFRAIADLGGFRH